jgi:hypothetical protein
VKRSKASGSSAERPIQAAYFPFTTAMPVKITAAVKTIDSQRWVCLIHLFQFTGISSIHEF